MTYLNELYLILNKSLKWNKSHLKCFALIMLVIILKQTCNRDSAANLGINCFIQNTKKLKQPSLMLLNTRYEALAAKFECVDTFEF